MTKPLIVELPYPKMEKQEEDKKTALILSKAYSGLHSELSAILQYVYHHYYLEQMGEEKIAKTLIEISLAEMMHLSMLGETLLKLGLDPKYINYTPFFSEHYSTKNLSYSNQKDKMLLDNLSGELVAIEQYKDIINNITNQKVQALLSRIILDEELHVKVLKEVMEE